MGNIIGSKALYLAQVVRYELAVVGKYKTPKTGMRGYGESQIVLDLAGDTLIKANCSLPHCMTNIHIIIIATYTLSY